MQKISLEQWRMFVAVVDFGGFAQAGDALYKTQSTISHGIKKLEGTLGKPLFDVTGRRAVPTPFGESLLVCARSLVSQADALEHDAISQKVDFRDSLSIAVDILFPRSILYEALEQFCLNHPQVNLQVYETVLSRCGELLDDGTVDMGIASAIPRGYVTELARTVDLHAVAHQAHPLAQLEAIGFDELERHRQVVIRDAGLRSNVNSGWLGSASRLTVSTLNEAYEAVNSRIGFAWLPDWFIRNKERQGNTLSRLQLKHGQSRTVALQAGIRPEMSDDPLVQVLLKSLLG